MKNSIMIIKICDKKADYKETTGDVYKPDDHEQSVLKKSLMITKSQAMNNSMMMKTMRLFMESYPIIWNG